MERASTTTRGIGAALILIAASIAAVPVLLHGLAGGDDFQFHLLSWLDAQLNWQHGIPYPHWAPNANYGAGEPRFLFYPPLTWMLGAALGSLLPWKLVPATLLFLLLAATGFATRALAREQLSEAPATLAGCVAILGGYAFYTAYARAAFAELAGGFWIPLLLLFALRDRKPDGAMWSNTAPLALVVAGAWLSNIPVGIMASYLLAAMAVVLAVQTRSLFPIVRAGIATILGLGLTGCYLLPAILEQRFVNPGAITDIPLFRVENHFLLPWHVDPVLSVHGVGLSFVVVLLAIPVVSVLAFFVRVRVGRNEEVRADRWWLALGVIPFAVLLLHLPVSAPVWRLLPRLGFLQYPWRLLLLLEAPTGIFFAAAVWPARSARLWRKIAIGAACGLLLVGSAEFAVRQFLLTRYQSGLADMLSAYQAGGGMDGIQEYADEAWNNSLVAVGLPDACLATNPNVVLGRDGSADINPVWLPGQGACIATAVASLREPEHQRIAMNDPRAGWLILRLRSYPAWRITVNGITASPIPRDKDGLVAVPVPAGPIAVAVDWTTTPDVLVGRGISVLSFAALAALYFAERRLARKT